MSRDVMQSIANYIVKLVGKKYGFVVLIYEHGDTGRMNYISNSNREDVAEAMKEFIIQTEEAWGAHKL